MIRIAVTGAAGRMGGRIIHVLRETAGLELGGAVEYAGHPRLGEDAGLAAGGASLGVTIGDSLENALAGSSVLIDFTTPEATLANLAVCRRLGTSMVIGTTGLSAEQKDEIRAAAEVIPIVFAPNMSIGVNVCLRVLKDLTRILGGDFEAEIVELHHNRKKDAPSGTALRMGEVIAEASGRDFAASAVYSRHGQIGERKREEIGLQTVRGGDIVGEHTVYFIGMGERIELSHRAMTRDMFARGAVRAAQWLEGKKAGLYDMQDVLGI
ncbi:MAG: 4-hydroxy-tetrahydrodipicolinate reductase [Desulfuromonadaceae bacterium]|nr:4-hydroxy-tetrahydrodipicolinate reductase [Desulfuromonadaceae bacterium]